MNRITIDGFIGADPEIKMAKDETLAEFSLAHTPWSKAKGEGETIWFRITFWNSKADTVLDNYRKGDHVRVEGTFTQSKYVKDGVEKLSIGITGTDISFIKTTKNGAPFVKSVHEESDKPSW